MDIKNVYLEIRMENESLLLEHPQQETVKNRQSFYFEYSRAGLSFAFHLTALEDCLYGHMEASVKNTPFRDNNNFAADAPITVHLKTQAPMEKLCALYQHRDWWTRPAFPSSIRELPDRTQALLFMQDNTAGFIFPLCGSKTKTYLHADVDGNLCFQTTAYTGGVNELDEPCFLMCQSPQPYKAVSTVMTRAAQLSGIPTRKERPYPEMFDTLGWCSWDAFYSNINANLMVEKAKELADKEIPVQWMLMDDGWHSKMDEQLTALTPDAEKFPGGFLPMIQKVKACLPVKHFGVWHALGGYWGGIHKDSPLAVQCENHLYATKNGKLLPHWQPERGFGFWHRWYSVLNSQGIDFVKVDGQSALKNYYKNNVEIGRAAMTHMGLEAAVMLHMNGQIINCMGMASENLLNRPISAINRNSDDFVPQTADGFFEHLLQNAYTAIYHHHLYYTDWDMFWTGSSDPFRHSLLRALSGGPVYFSDKIGESQPENIWPLVYSDGRILRADQSAVPTPDCLFANPEATGFVKLSTICNGCGVEALFCHDTTGTDRKITFSPSEITGLDVPELDVPVLDVPGPPDSCGLYLAYDFFGHQATVIESKTACPVTSTKEGCALMYFIPIKAPVTPIGLLDKYLAPHAVMESFAEPGCFHIKLYEGGRFGFYTRARLSRICADQLSVQASLMPGGYYSVEVPSTGKPVWLTIYYETKKL